MDGRVCVWPWKWMGHVWESKLLEDPLSSSVSKQSLGVMRDTQGKGGSDDQCYIATWPKVKHSFSQAYPCVRACVRCVVGRNLFFPRHRICEQ